MAYVILNWSRKVVMQTYELINVVQVTPYITDSMGRTGRAIN